MSDSKLGRWANDNLANALSSYDGTEYYALFPKEVHFTHSVAKILTLCYAKNPDLLLSKPSFFILGAVPEDDITMGFKREPTFSLGKIDVSGKVWFGSEAFNSSKGIKLPDTLDADDLFTFVSQDLKSGNLPTIFLDHDIHEMKFRYYPKGVDDPDTCIDIPFGSEYLDKDRLKKALDKIHELSLVTPTASMLSGQLWGNNSKHYPGNRTESTVQTIVSIGLAHALGNVRVKREGTGIYGRYDLSLIEKDPLEPTKTINHAILELKIVKAYTSSGVKCSDTLNQNAIVKGIKQAYAYRSENGSRISALCCYDMRPNPNLHEYDGTKCKIASDLDVEFWAWPLYPTADALRDVLAKQQVDDTP